MEAPAPRAVTDLHADLVWCVSWIPTTNTTTTAAGTGREGDRARPEAGGTRPRARVTHVFSPSLLL
jgi:hypothetical protein